MWAKCAKWCGFHWVILGSTVDLLKLWQGKKLRKKARVIWNIIPLAMFWCTWKLRNGMKFEGVRPNWDLAGEMVLRTIISWAKVHPLFSQFSVDDLLFNFNSVSHNW